MIAASSHHAHYLAPPSVQQHAAPCQAEMSSKPDQFGEVPIQTRSTATSFDQSEKQIIVTRGFLEMDRLNCP